MPNEVFGTVPKKETVYSGTAVATQPSAPASRPAAGTGAGTVYSGPVPGGSVYNPAQPAPRGPQTQQPRATTAAASTGATKGAAIFYIIAAFTAANMVLIYAGVRFAVGLGATRAVRQDQITLAVANLLAIGIFVLLGVFAKRGSKAAFMIGMLLYAGDLVVLVMNNPELNIISIVIHAFFLFRLFQAFRELPA